MSIENVVKSLRDLKSIVKLNLMDSHTPFYLQYSERHIINIDDSDQEDYTVDKMIPKKVDMLQSQDQSELNVQTYQTNTSYNSRTPLNLR